MNWTRLVRGTTASAACVAAVVAVAACGSSSSSSSSAAAPSSSAGSTTASTPSGSSGSAGASGAVLGTAHTAGGTPVKFGMINIETNAGADFPEVRESAQAAIQYINNYAAGSTATRSSSTPCITDGSPATSVQCANKLVAQHPVGDPRRHRPRRRRYASDPTRRPASICSAAWTSLPPSPRRRTR